MAVAYKQEYSSDFADIDTDTFGLPSVQADTGETILFTVQYRDAGTRNISTLPTWNGETFVSTGARANGFFWTQSFKLTTASTATANIICPTDGGQFFTGNSVARVYTGVTSVGPLQQQVRTSSSGYANPSLTASDMTAADMVDVIGSFSGYDDGFATNLLSTTWSEAASQTNRVVVSNANQQAGNTYYSTAVGTGSVAIGYNTPTPASTPAYVLSAHILRGGATATLSTLDAAAAVGGTGYSATTANMAAITSLTNATITGTSANAFTYSMNAFAHGVAYLNIGSPTFTAGDGTLTATKASPLATMAGYTAVTMAGTLNTGEWSIAKDPAIVLGDVIHLPTAGGVLNADGTLGDGAGGDYVFGTYTMWRWEAATGIMYTSQLTVTNSGISINWGMTSPNLTSADMTSRDITLRY